MPFARWLLPFELLYNGKCAKLPMCEYSHSDIDIKRVKDRILVDFMRVFGSEMESSFKSGKVPDQWEAVRRKGMPPRASTPNPRSA